MTWQGTPWKAAMERSGETGRVAGGHWQSCRSCRDYRQQIDPAAAPPLSHCLPWARSPTALQPAWQRFRVEQLPHSPRCTHQSQVHRQAPHLTGF